RSCPWRPATRTHGPHAGKPELVNTSMNTLRRRGRCKRTPTVQNNQDEGEPASPPTRERFRAAVESARAAGGRAAEERYLELAWRIEAQEPLLEACGVALLIVKADGRTALGKLLGTLARNPILGVSVTRLRRGQYMVSVQGTSRYQG